MKAKVKKTLALLMAVTMLLSSFSISALAAALVDGNNGNTIYLFTNVVNDSDETASSVASGETFYVQICFANNPTDTTNKNNIYSATAILEFDPTDMQLTSIDDGNHGTNGNTNPVFNNNAEGVVTAGVMTSGGFKLKNASNKWAVLESGALAFVEFEAKKDLTSADLDKIKILATYGSADAAVNTRVVDGNNKTFTVIQTPALAVTVADDVTFYDTTTAAELKAALTVESIAKDGTKTPVTDFSIDVTELNVGENTVTVTADGLSETVKITAAEDKVESIAVTTQPKLNYTSGDKLDLSGMVVTATCTSGKTKPVEGYSASIENGTALTVKNHNGHTITITVGDKTAKTDALTVTKLAVAIPTAKGTYIYTGSEQEFDVDNTSGEAYYDITGNTKGTNVGTYTATAILKDTEETQWSDGSTEPKTLTWEIKADTTALTVELPEDATYTYNGSEQRPVVTVKRGDTTLTANTDYTVEYANNVNAGTATVKVTGAGNYAGATGTATFTINPVELTAEDLGFSGSTEKTYDDNADAPADLKVQVKNTSLKKSDDEVTVTGTLAYDSADASDGRTITFTANGITTGNYRLDAGTKLTTGGKINAKDVTRTEAATSQNIVKGVGTFNEPTFGDITGTLSYSYNGTNYGYGDLVTALKALPKDATGTINYTFTANGNYTGTITGSISFTVVDILFTVGNETATAENALTVKESITYGDNWSDIVKFKDGVTITASVGEQTGTGTYALQQTGRPNAGNQSYTVVFNGTVGETTYTNTPVLTDTVNVAKKELTLTGLTVCSKMYDGKTVAALDYEKASLEGVVKGDNVSYVYNAPATGNYADFASKDAGTHAVTIHGQFVLNAGGGKDQNYTLIQPTGLTGTITQAKLTVTDATAKSRNYDPDSKAVEIESVTFSGVVAGETLAIGTDYTATGEMDDENAGNKNVKVTVKLDNSVKNYKLESTTVTTTTTVKINKINWADQTLFTASGKYGSTVTVDASELPSGATKIEKQDALFTGVKAVSGEYKLTLVNDSSKVDSVAEYSETRYNMTNYNDFTWTIKITILDKTEQSLTADPVSVVYGGTFTPVVKPKATDKQFKVSFQLKKDETLLEQNADGSLTAIGSGTTTVTAIAEETAECQSATKEITVNIGKRPMTVTANDVSIYVGETVPELTYTVSGMLESDSWAVEPELSIVEKVDTSKVGEYFISLGPGTIKDHDGDYEIGYISGKLSITAHATVTPVSGKTVTVDAADNGSVSISPSKASAGKTVTVTVTPDQGYELEELLVTDRKGNALTVTDLGNGKYNFVMPASSVTVSASFAKVKQGSYYADVLPDAWYYDAVQYVTEQGLMGGTGKGFEPELTTSRAMIWTILARMDGVDTAATNGSWYVVAQSWAMANGVSDGTEPDGLITREQLAVMLYRYAVSKGVDVSVGEDTNILSYADATSVSEWAVPALQWACGTGIINGVDGSLLPQGNADRAQTATMLMRFLELVK